MPMRQLLTVLSQAQFCTFDQIEPSYTYILLIFKLSSTSESIFAHGPPTPLPPPRTYIFDRNRLWGGGAPVQIINYTWRLGGGGGGEGASDRTHFVARQKACRRLKTFLRCAPPYPPHPLLFQHEQNSCCRSTYIDSKNVVGGGGDNV